MSRTYNTKHDFFKEYGTYEFPNGFKNDYGLEIKPGEEYETDPSFTTFNDNSDLWQKLTRHPNKKRKKGSLDREFKTVGMTSPSHWKNRFGEENDKSSRMRLIKRELTQKRRNKLKNQANKIIEESLIE